MIPRLCAVALAASALAFAQLDTNTVTVTASRTLTVQPDQVVFGVSVTSGFSSSLTDVLNALQPVGVTAAEFVGVSSLITGVSTAVGSGNLPLPQLLWTFVLPEPFASLKSTVTALMNLQQSVTQNSSGFTLSFSLQGTQVSQQLQQMQVCPLTDIMSDAQLQAQKLAHVAGASLGTVLALTNSAPNTINIPTAVARFSPAIYVYDPQYASTPTTCAITVKFSLLP